MNMNDDDLVRFASACSGIAISRFPLPLNPPKWNEVQKLLLSVPANGSVPDFSDIIGRHVSGVIDRPLNTRHPRHPDMIYPINYGYVEGVIAGDGAEQDVYVFGIEKPIRTYTGKVVGVIHRLNDNEDKWIVSLSGAKIPREEILARTEFQEQYFMSELYL